MCHPHNAHSRTRPLTHALSHQPAAHQVPVKAMAKDAVVSDKADLRTRKLTEEDVFLILACDGLWDVVNSDEACREVARAMSAGEDAAEALGLKATKRGSMDNITVLVLYFDWEDYEEVPHSATAKALREMSAANGTHHPSGHPVGQLGEKVVNGYRKLSTDVRESVQRPAGGGRSNAEGVAGASGGDLDKLKRLHGKMKGASGE